MLQCYEIPLISAPSQEFKVRLGQFDCAMRLFQRASYMYLDFYIGGISVRLGAAVRVNKPILLDVPAAVFTGNLYIVDTRGLGVYPDYSGLGSRWKLAYVFDDGVIVEEPKE